MRYAVRTGYLNRHTVWVVSRVGIKCPHKSINIVEWYMWKGKRVYRFCTRSHDDTLEAFDKLMRGIGMRDYVAYGGDK